MCFLTPFLFYPSHHQLELAVWLFNNKKGNKILGYRLSKQQIAYSFRTHLQTCDLNQRFRLFFLRFLRISRKKEKFNYETPFSGDIHFNWFKVLLPMRGMKKAKSRVHEINLLAAVLIEITEKERKNRGRVRRTKAPELVNEQRTLSLARMIKTKK